MLTLDPRHTALLLMDLQADIVPRIGEKAAPLLERAAALLAAARQARVPVIHVVVGFRPGYPEVSPRNAAFSMAAKSGRLVTTHPGSDIAPEVHPEAGELIVFKHRVGAFSGTELELLLRAKDLHTLVLGGIATSGVVLSTLRHAADADYQLIVAKDACADADDEIHRVLMEKVFPRQATVLSAAEVVSQLLGAAS